MGIGKVWSLDHLTRHLQVIFKMGANLNKVAEFVGVSSSQTTIVEERFQFVEWLYRIRKQHGNHYGFLQPDFICIIFGKMMVSKYIRTNNDIHDAVNEWRDNPVVAEVKYGHISKWNTGR